MSAVLFKSCTRATRFIHLAERTYSSPAAPATSSAKHPLKSRPQSSCAADTVLEGLNYLKDQQPVLAKPDEEYPDWLWSLLEPKQIEDDGPGGKAERSQRRKDNKKKIRERNFMTTQ